MKTVEFFAKNEEITNEISTLLGKTIKESFENESIIVCLNGDLGAGKTFFTKGFAKGIEIEEDITSPTFIYLNEYYSDITLYHFDVYMMEDVDEFFEMSFYEYIYEKKGVIIIEWAEKIKEILPQDYIDVHIEFHKEGERKLRIDFPNKFEKIGNKVEKLNLN